MRRILSNGIEVEEFVDLVMKVGGLDYLVQVRCRSEQNLRETNDPEVRQRAQWLIDECDKHLIDEHATTCSCSLLN